VGPRKAGTNVAQAYARFAATIARNASLPHLRKTGHAPSLLDAIETAAATGQRQTLG